MSIDLSRLEHVRHSGGRVIARCPACAEDDHDSKGEHLVIMDDGRFGCVVYSGDAGKKHRRRILELAGDDASRLRGDLNVRVRRPFHMTSERTPGKIVDLGCLGRAGTDPPPPSEKKETKGKKRPRPGFRVK